MARTKRRKRRNRSGYRSPGVYVEEVPSGARPLEGVGTAVAAFVGFAPLNPLRLGTSVLVVSGIALAVLKGRAATRST